MDTSLSLRRTVRLLLVGFVLAATLLVGLQAQRAGAQTADELCVSLYTGEVVYRPAGCGPGYLALDLTAAEVTVCWSLYTGQVTYPGTGECGYGTQPLTLGGAATVTLCVSAYTGQLRFTSTGACPAGSYAVEVEPVAQPTVTIQSVSSAIVVDFIATNFAPNSVLIDYAYSVPALGVSDDLADIFLPGTFVTNANGVYDSSLGLSGFGCVEGAPGSITITDSDGNTATGNFTLSCT